MRNILPMRLNLPLATLLLVPLAGCWSNAVAGTRRGAPAFERELSASPGETLDLELDTGANIDVRGWEESNVRVRAWLGGKDAEGSRIEVEREGDGIRVVMRHRDDDRSYSTSHDLEIRVPRRFNIKVGSAGGDITLSGMEGSFRGNTGGGDIVLENMKGKAELNTGGGEINVSDSELDGWVNTGGGEVKISRVRGKFRGNSGSGPVIYEETDHDGEHRAERRRHRHKKHHEDGDEDGDEDHQGECTDKKDERGSSKIRIDKAGGDVDLEKAPKGAIVNTGGGRIRIGPAGGTVDANTGGGSIELGPVSGSVRASTGSGQVYVKVGRADGEEQTIDIASGTGRVIIDLLDDFKGTFDLETAYTKSHGKKTRIISDIALDVRETDEWDGSNGTPRRFVRARRAGGGDRGGGWVRVRTVNGDIEIRRSTAGREPTRGSGARWPARRRPDLGDGPRPAR